MGITRKFQRQKVEHPNSHLTIDEKIINLSKILRQYGWKGKLQLKKLNKKQKIGIYGYFCQLYKMIEVDIV